MPPEAVAALPATSRVIVVAGPYRSGSTPMFNIARLLLEQNGQPLTSGWIDDIAEPVRSTILVKVHEWNADLARRANIVLTCHRDLRAVARSLACMGWLWELCLPGASVRDHIHHIVRLHARWRALGVLDLRYEDMVGDWMAAVTEVAFALGLQPSAAELASVAWRVAGMMPTPLAADRAYDPVTLMYRNHRQATATSAAPLRIEDEIHQEFNGWQASHGYR